MSARQSSSNAASTSFTINDILGSIIISYVQIIIFHICILSPWNHIISHLVIIDQLLINGCYLFVHFFLCKFLGNRFFQGDEDI